MRNRKDPEKARYWRGVIREAARSGMSVRAFCLRRKLNEAQFYWWRNRLKETQRQQTIRKNGGASFALVTGEAGATDAGLELVLADGRRLRIGKGVDEATLRSVLAVVQGGGC